METNLKIKVVGYYTHPIADITDCKVCGDADYGDVIINGVCGRCLLNAYNAGSKNKIFQFSISRVIDLRAKPVDTPQAPAMTISRKEKR